MVDKGGGLVESVVLVVCSCKMIFVSLCIFVFYRAYMFNNFVSEIQIMTLAMGCKDEI